MAREIEEPVVAEDGWETHPAFGVVAVGRVSSSGPQTLFDSEIGHRHFVELTISTATRKRDLSRDWIHEGKQLTTVYMSEAQWAQMVSSLNSGTTPCTIRHTESVFRVPEIPYAPRLEMSRKEVHEAAERTYEAVKAAFAAVEDKPTKANIRALRIELERATSNVDYVTKTLDEHTENTVTKAKADLEAMAHYAALSAHLALPRVQTDDPELEA